MTDEDVAVRLAEHEQKIGSLKHRVDDLEDVVKGIQDLTTSVNKLALNMEGVLSELKGQNGRLKELEDKPAKAWTSMQKTFFTTITSTIAGALAMAIIMQLAQYWR